MRRGLSVDDLRVELTKPGAPYAYRLRFCRLVAGLTQAELARLARVEQAAVSRWESGRDRPVVSSARRLARVLGDAELEYIVAVRGTTEQSALDTMRAAGVDFNRIEQYGIGTQLRYHRCRRGYTLTSLAERAGVSKETVSVIERGSVRPQWRTLRALDAVLDTDFVAWRARQVAQTTRATRAVHRLPFPDWFRYHREHAALSVHALAERAGVNYKAVLSVENESAEPRGGTMRWLCEALPADTDEALRRYGVYSAQRWCPPYPLTFFEALEYRRRLFWLSARDLEEGAGFYRTFWRQVERGHQTLQERHVERAAAALRLSARGVAAWAKAHDDVAEWARRCLLSGAPLDRIHPRIVSVEREQLRKRGRL